jgi:hypothetical protein
MDSANSALLLFITRWSGAFQCSGTSSDIRVPLACEKAAVEPSRCPFRTAEAAEWHHPVQRPAHADLKFSMLSAHHSHKPLTLFDEENKVSLHSHQRRAALVQSMSASMSDCISAFCTLISRRMREILRCSSASCLSMSAPNGSTRLGQRENRYASR